MKVLNIKNFQIRFQITQIKELNRLYLVKTARMTNDLDTVVFMSLQFLFSSI